MSFDNTTPEPKNKYLNDLITLDFVTTERLYLARDYIGAINAMAALIDQAMCWEVAELKDVIAKIDSCFDNQSAPIEELRPIHRKLKKYLNEHWFSELRLGIIPTSTIPGESPLPAKKSFDPNQTSRI